MHECVHVHVCAGAGVGEWGGGVLPAFQPSPLTLSPTQGLSLRWTQGEKGGEHAEPPHLFKPPTTSSTFHIYEGPAFPFNIRNIWLIIHYDFMEPPSYIWAHDCTSWKECML